MRSNLTNGRQDTTAHTETAVSILGWLAGDPELLQRFLALSGLQADQLRAAVNDPGFLAGIVDFLMGHEPTLIAFCDATNIKPETVVAAWQHFSGPGLGSGEY